jgi:hypothetical protein
VLVIFIFYICGARKLATECPVPKKKEKRKKEHPSKVVKSWWAPKKIG